MPPPTFRTLEETLTPHRQRFRALMAAAMGSIPWVGGLLSGRSDLADQAEQGGVNTLHREWLEEHARKLQLTSSMSL